MRNLVWFILFLAVQCKGVISYKVLEIFMVHCPSHYMIGSSLMKGLIADGHEVTMISPFKEKKTFENHTEIYLDGIVEYVGKFRLIITIFTTMKQLKHST